MCFHRSAIALTILLAGALALRAQTPEKAKKVAPDTVTVFLDDGVGSRIPPVPDELP